MTKFKFYFKMSLYFIGVLAITVVSILLSKKSKKITEMERDLRLAQADSEIKLTEEKIRANEAKIAAMKAGDSVSTEKVQSLEIKQEQFNRDLDSKKRSADELRQIYNSL